MCTIVPIFILIAFVVIINILQAKKPTWLPNKIRTWDFLPIYLHSLEPYDTILRRLFLDKFENWRMQRKEKKSNANDKISPHTNEILTLDSDFNTQNFYLLLDKSNLYQLNKLYDNNRSLYVTKTNS